MTCSHDSGFGHSLGIDDGHPHCLDCGIREADAIESKWALAAADGIVSDLAELAAAPDDMNLIRKLTVRLNRQCENYGKIRNPGGIAS